MKRLIDAEAFERRCMFDENIEDMQDVIYALRDYQAVDAEPVRHVKNIGTDYSEVDQFVCSECGIELQNWHRVEHDDDGEETYHEYRLRYCPNCGGRITEE